MKPRRAEKSPQAASAGFYVPGEFRPDQSVGYLMRNVIGSIRERANTRLAAHDLTYVQWLPLYKLAMKQGNTVASLARELEIDAGAMTRSMDRLEAKGLVRRERSTSDRRVVFLVLTAEGRKVARKVPAVLSEVLNGHLQGFSNEEWQLLLQFLNRMLANGQGLREAATG
jgi:DNA-binding MarR family transcriptional regulator